MPRQRCVHALGKSREPEFAVLLCSLGLNCCCVALGFLRVFYVLIDNKRSMMLATAVALCATMAMFAGQSVSFSLPGHRGDLAA